MNSTSRLLSSSSSRSHRSASASSKRTRLGLHQLALFTFLVLPCCRTTPPEPESTVHQEPVPPAPPPAVPPTPPPEPSAVASAAPAASAVGNGGTSNGGALATSAAALVPVPAGHRRVTAKPVQQVPVTPDDPLHGKFTLEEATHGLTGKGKLIADIRTELGKLECELYDDKAPLTVANFIGLARGLRPFKNPKGEWVKTAAYDGTTFHRIIKGFMIQGGDPAGTGAGEPGYNVPDEIWADAYHSERGLLCMANRGPNTNGMQFFIMDGSAPHLDGGYTIFGKCGPDSVIEKLANLEVKGDRAEKPPKIQKVTVHRGTLKGKESAKPETTPRPAAPRPAAPAPAPTPPVAAPAQSG